jgi:hypothetical protein
MDFLRRIHPSATLFVGVLLAFTLPFGYSAEACGSQTQTYRAADLLVLNVEPGGSSAADAEYAESVAESGLVFAWLLLVAAVLGLRAAVLGGGRRWATWCAVTAALTLLMGFFVIDAGEIDIGWLLTLFLTAGGVVLKILIALGSWLHGRFAPAVTTPDEPAVR